ncbi:hypothetical protein [Streptomyces sp. NPDC007007]
MIDETRSWGIEASRTTTAR